MKYVIIGGAGAMGRIAVRDLFEFAESDDEIVIADYNFAKAEALARGYADQRVIAKQVDVLSVDEAVEVLRGAVVVLNCLQHNLNLHVMEAALRAGCHYIDLGGLFHWTTKQLRLDERFRAAGRLAILGMGAAPGITNVLARMGADELETVREIHCRVAGVDKTRYENPRPLPISYSLQTIMEEFSLEPAVFTRGKLTFVPPISGQTPMRFPPPVDVQRPMYTIHSELATLPSSFAQKGVQEVSFKIAFDPDFLQKIKFLRDLGLASHEPIPVGGAKISPIELLNKVAASQKSARRIGNPKQYEIVRTIVKGTKRGKKMTLVLDCHTAGKPRWEIGSDINTGSPPAIVARMIAAGEIKGAGVFAPEQVVPPGAFCAELKKRGFKLRTKQQAGWALKT